MSRLEVTAVKGSLAAITSFLIYIAGIVNEIIVVLVFFMILDFITGMLRGYLTKSLNSTLGISGIIKKFAILIMIGMAGGIEYIIMSVGQEPQGLVILAVTSFFVVNEGISILENCAQLGLPIPPALFNALEKMHRDPLGKEQFVLRSNELEKTDKQELMKENEVLQQEIKKEDHRKGGDEF